MSRPSANKIQAIVVRALQDACLGTDLAVCGPDGISGGFVIGEVVEAYVVAEANGYQVELWTREGQDAYRIIPFANLVDAIRCAVDAADDAADDADGRPLIAA